MKNEIEIKISDIVWQPTMNLRWVSAMRCNNVFKAGCVDSSHEYNMLVLQQEFVNQFGESEWRDIPVV